MSRGERPRKAVITGGAAGLGAAIAQQLAASGFVVWIVDRDLPAFAPAEQALQCDLSDLDGLSQLSDHLIQIGPFDLVVMSAGISAVGAFETLPAAALRDVVAVNCIAPVILTRELLARGLIAKGGRLVFVSSLSHFTGYPGASAYAASKDALVAFARSLRRPLRSGHAITVQVTTPGPMRTAHAERYAPAGSSGKGRADPAEVARNILRNRRRFMIVPGLPAKAMARFGWHFPGYATRAMRKIIFEKLI
ncbi:MAG: SDR family NAD(P)-dependent oxidoreductase [Rhodobacterales bacterium]